MTRLTRRCLLIALVAACGGGPTDPGDNGATRITLTSGLQFSPNDITIDPGTTIRWFASTSTAHTVTPDNTALPGVWIRATSASSGTVLLHTFTVPGQVYTYHCEVHAGMNGTIRVR